jgi:hypothetical protein
MHPAGYIARGRIEFKRGAEKQSNTGRYKPG